MFEECGDRGVIFLCFACGVGDGDLRPSRLVGSL